jgi:hypothetical protein
MSLTEPPLRESIGLTQLTSKPAIGIDPEILFASHPHNLLLCLFCHLHFAFGEKTTWENSIQREDDITLANVKLFSALN